MANKQPEATVKPKRKRWVTRQSKRREKEARIYQRKRRQFLKCHMRCQCCKDNKSEDVHHIRGRAGTLFLDARFWLAVCRPCHDDIHNPKLRAEMIESEWLAGPGEWNVPVPKSNPEI